MNMRLFLQFALPAFGLVFGNFALLNALTRRDRRARRAFAVFLADVSLMCLAGGIFMLPELQGLFYSSAAYYFQLLLAPLGAQYVLSFLAPPWPVRGLTWAGVSLSTFTFAVLVTLVALGSPLQVLYLGVYSYNSLYLGIVLGLVVPEIGPWRTLERRVKVWLVIVALCFSHTLVLLVLQSLGLMGGVYIAWITVVVALNGLCLASWLLPEEFRKTQQAVASARWKNSVLGELDASALVARLQERMESTEAFRHPDLTVQTLGAQIGLSASQLSELLNVHLGTGFPAFVNGYRIAWAQRRLVERPDDSVLVVGFDAGFNSKSTFNDQFKKATGMTPREFRESRQAEPVGAGS
jgi:AraC-like DNA-binding protein